MQVTPASVRREIVSIATQKSSYIVYGLNNSAYRTTIRLNIIYLCGLVRILIANAMAASSS